MLANSGHTTIPTLAQQYANILDQRWADEQNYCGPTYIYQRWPNHVGDVGPTLAQLRLAIWDRLCDVCDSQQIEDEFHFILQCPKYLHIRKKYLNNYHYKSPSVYKLLQLLGSQHTPTLADLGKYLH
jgi:hypothetical protein